jgi:hypothetical protein
MPFCTVAYARFQKADAVAGCASGLSCHFGVNRWPRRVKRAFLLRASPGMIGEVDIRFSLMMTIWSSACLVASEWSF